MLARRPELDAERGFPEGWRRQADALVAEARAMLAQGSAHRSHLDAMSEERQALIDAMQRLDGAAIAAGAAEMNRLAAMTEAAAEETGGIAFDAEGYELLMERVHSLEARHLLPEDVRDAVWDRLQRHERWEQDRADVDAVLDMAGQVLLNRESLPSTWDEWRRDAGAILENARSLQRDIPERELAAHLAAAGAGPGAIAEAAGHIEDRIGQNEQARAAAEQKR